MEEAKAIKSHAVRLELRRQARIKEHAKRIARSELRLVPRGETSATSRASLISLRKEVQAAINQDLDAIQSGRPADIVRAAAKEVEDREFRDGTAEALEDQMERERLRASRPKKGIPIRALGKRDREAVLDSLASGQEPWTSGPYETDDLLSGPIRPATGPEEVMSIQSGVKDFHSAQRQLEETPLTEPEQLALLRQARYSRRFDIVGDFWERKLRLLRYRQSLRHAFEIPGLFSLRLKDTGYMLSRTQFVSALHFAIEPNDDLVPPRELGAFYHNVFDALHVTGKGRVDYREGLVLLHFFRMPTDQTATSFARELFRCWDGLHHGGLTMEEFQQMLASICVSAMEIRNMLEGVNWKFVQQLQAEFNERRGGGGGRGGGGEGDGGGGGDRFVTDRSLALIVDNSPKLREALLRTRLSRFPPVLRGALIRAKTEARMVAAQRKYEKLRTKAQMARAAALWRRSSTNGYFRRWVAAVARARKVRILVDRQRAIRAVRHWCRWKERHRLWMAKNNVAYTFRTSRFLRRVFGAWLHWLDDRHRRDEALTRRAVRAYQHMVLERCFSTLYLHRGILKARRYRRSKETRRVLHALRTYLADLRGRGESKRYVRLREEARAKRDAERLRRIEVDAVARAEKRHFEQEVDLFEDEARLALEIAEEKRKQEKKEREEHDAMVIAKARERRLLKYERDEVLWRARFNRTWEKEWEKRSIDIRRNIVPFLSSPAGKEIIAKEARRLAAIRSPELIAQRGSEWEVFDVVTRRGKDPRILRGPIFPDVTEVDIDKKDTDTTAGGGGEGEGGGSEEEESEEEESEEEEEVVEMKTGGDKSESELIAGSSGQRMFIAVHSGTKQRARVCPIRDSNFAKTFAIANYIAKELQKGLMQLAEERDAALRHHYGEKLVKAMIGRHRARRFRNVLLETLRSLTEELIDVETGDVYYVDRRSHVRSDKKPILFGDEMVRPAPAWSLRRNAGTGQLYYHCEAAPWRSTPDVPDSLILCSICHLQPSDRRCHGHECDGLPYCYQCWEDQHPVAVEEYRAHESHIERIPVRPERCVNCELLADLIIWSGEAKYRCYCTECHGGLHEELKALPTYPLRGRTSADVAAALAAVEQAQAEAEAAAAHNAAHGWGPPEIAWGEDISQW